MSKKVTTLILGGGQGKRLFPLTSDRSKPAVPIGGKYRLVDIPISNSINSGFNQIYVLTQFNSTSLHRHIHRTYPYEVFNQTSIELLAAEQTFATTDWFQGTADAVRKHMPHYHLPKDGLVLILSGDHLYRMDYRDIISYHLESNADVTVATVPVPKREVRHFGIMQLKKDGRIHAFKEKPAPSENIKSFNVPEPIRQIFGLKSGKESYLASMGVYVFNAKALREVLEGNDTDFGKEVIPKAIDRFNVYGYVFNGYWRDIGTIEAFYNASIELTHPSPQFDFLAPKQRIFTRPRFLPPARFDNTKLKNTLMGEGCVIEGASIEDSVIGLRSIVREGTVIKESVCMGNDYYDSEEKPLRGKLGIGKNCRIQNCILDKNVVIGNNVSITNSKKIQEKDGNRYYIREGIVIIPKGMKIPEGTKI